MNIMMLLDMAATGYGKRTAIGSTPGFGYEELRDRAAAGAEVLRAERATSLVFATTSGPAFPVALFAAAWAGVPFVPLNYRLSDGQLREMVEDHQPAVVIADEASVERFAGVEGTAAMTAVEWLAATERSADPGDWTDHDNDIALLLYTSGTTSAPKAAVLRHRHLVSYILGTVDFGAADEGAVSLVSVPPYHIAGVSNALSNIYSGRRIVYLPVFTPEAWLETVRGEGVTHALVVPTMLARIVESLHGAPDAEVPTLKSIAYGGARMPMAVLERALDLFPDADFVNAYGLTETSSTIAVLTPEDHRAALASQNPNARHRLGSVGRVIPGVEIEIRSGDGSPLPPGEAGDIWVRGEQVSGEYAGQDSAGDTGGWFDTRDRGYLDDAGYLFIEGRSDDTIIRGGENIAPAEIEEVLYRHPALIDAAVVGFPDDEWGERIVAVVVVRPGSALDPEEVREWVRARLRSSKTPDQIVLSTDLPRTDTGKLLRRKVVENLVPFTNLDLTS